MQNPVFCLWRNGQPLNLNDPIMGCPRLTVASRLEDITVFETVFSARSFIRFYLENPGKLDVSGVGTAELTFSTKVVDTEI